MVLDPAAARVPMPSPSGTAGTTPTGRPRDVAQPRVPQRPVDQQRAAAAGRDTAALHEGRDIDAAGSAESGFGRHR